MGIGAQTTISGTILDAETYEPLIGASVLAGTTNTGTVTDLDGLFTLTVPEGVEEIAVSYTGYQTQTIPLDGRTEYTLSLMPGTALDEVVVTGYSTQRKADLTGAVAVADLEDIETLPAGNILQNLQGRLAGVQIFTNGNPNSTASVRIRGVGIGRLGNNDPLYVIDGVPSTSGLHELNTNDIESFQVLRDAASASIYGSRAANGASSSGWRATASSTSSAGASPRSGSMAT